MRRKKRKRYSIREAPQVQALAAPTRQEILDALEVSGPATVATLGTMLGRAPDSLYHHLRILLRVGLVRKVKPRPTDSTREAVYDLPARLMEIAYDLQNPAMTRAIIAVVRSMSRISCRDFERAAVGSDAMVKGPRRNLRGARMKGMLDASQIEAINRHYQQIVDIMSDPRPDRRNAKLHAVTFLMSPLPVKRSAKARRRLRG